MRDPQGFLEPRPRWRAALWAAVLALLALSVALADSAWQNHMQAKSREEGIARMRMAAQPKPIPKPSRAELEMQKRWANMESERAFAWYPIFRALEAANSEDIELLEFAPDKAGRRLVLRGEARDLAALFAYVRTLSEQPAFRQLYLAHQKVESVGTLTTVAFELRAQLK